MSSRRQFIKSSGTLAALAAFSPSPWKISNDSIKEIGLQLWSIGKFLEKDFNGSLDMLAQIGYKRLELFGPYPFSSQKDKDSWKSLAPIVGFSQSGYCNHTAQEFRQILDAKGLTAPSMHVGLDTLRNNMGPLAESAHIVGQQYAGLAAIPEEERKTLDDYKRMADDFNKIGENAKKNGLKFFYHNHGYGLKEVNGTVPFDLILKNTDPALVFFELDVFWNVAGGGDPVKYLDNNRGRFKLMHVKDMTKKVHFSGGGDSPKEWVELFPYITDAGKGVLDLKNIVAHGERSGVEHFIVENDVITDPKKSLEQGYQFLHGL